ncbi:MAG TPA: 2-C-methyl-D-erythritol 4-phosphate cytidylyltransferase [Fodinibius sp.]|nr:2-C-methyl-D-erythritol 4-phosphate cytidylyltransferase [Fodinibius sp.]
MHTKALVIAAAGSGSRMRKKVPKPYLKLGDYTILERTLRAFLSLSGMAQVVVATSKDRMDEARGILSAILPEDINGLVVAGGRDRQHSIRQALQHVAEIDLVLVQDAVRPFVDAQDIKACCSAAANMGAAVLGVPVKDTIKQVDDRRQICETPDRNMLWKAQTPQVFRKSLLLKAYDYAQKEELTVTDDASIVEAMGQPVKIVEGGRENIKITYPLDLELARIILNKIEQ